MILSICVSSEHNIIYDNRFFFKLSAFSFRELVEHFDGEQWSNNGPGLLTRILKRVCKTDNISEMFGDRCLGFQVLPQKYCYAISYPEYLKFFDGGYLKEVLEKIEDSIIAHVWNKLSESTKLSVNSSAAYIHLAKQYCPKVIEACGEYF